jgi:hypothetical protein
LRPPDNEVAIQIKKLFAAIDDENIAEARRICDLLRASDPRGFDPDLTRAELQLHRLERKAAK